MAIKAGQILHVGNGLVVDRIQSAGAGSINVNSERIEELGNYSAVAVTRDTPDLSFEMESYDMSTEIHQLLFNAGAGDASGTQYSPETDVIPIDVLSPFKGEGSYDVVRALAIPYLNIESMTWTFSVDNPASLNVGLRGDSIFYIPGDAYRETFVGDGGTASFTFGAGTGGETGPALSTTIDGTARYVLGCMIEDTTTTPNTFTRLRYGVNYTETSTSITLLSPYDALPATTNIYVIYGNATLSTYSTGVHKAVATGSPAAVKGRNIQVSLDGTTWYGIQSASVEWRATLERDEELGNANIVDQDFDVPEVSGTITMKAATAAALFDQILAANDITSPGIVNAVVDPAQLALEMVVQDPANGSTLQTLIVPDAQFDPIALQGQVGNKLEVDFNYSSAGGDLNIYKGDN